MKKTKATKKQKIWAVIGLLAVAVALVLFITVGIPMIKDHKNSAYNSKYKYDGTSIVGKWQEKEDFNDAFYKIYDYRSDGRVVTSLYVYGIEAVRDETSTYRIDGTNTLVITYSVNSVLYSSETKFSISDDQSTLVIKDGTNYTVLEEYNLEYNEDTSIFGEWVSTENSSETLILNEDYSGEMKESGESDEILFSTNKDKFYLFINEDYSHVPELSDYTLKEKYVIEYEYNIENGILTLNSEGDNKSYQRRK